jgi:Flp pilus assembly protein TadB
MLPAWWVGMKKSSRMRRFEGQLVDLMGLLSNSLKSGYGLMQSFEFAGRQMEPPIALEIRRMLRDANLGMSAEDALLAMGERIGSKDLDMVLTAINIQRAVGGNLAEILDQVSATMRERERIRGDIATLTSQQRMTGIVIGGLPVAMFILFMLMNPGYMGLLFTEMAGGSCWSAQHRWKYLATSRSSGLWRSISRGAKVMLLILIALTVAASVTVTVVSLLNRPAPASIESRITDFRQRAGAGEAEIVDLEVPFVDRILRPTIQAISGGFGSILPASLLASLQKQLIMAGNPMTLNAFVTFWAVLLAAFGGVGLLLFVTLPSSMVLQKLAAFCVLLILGWMFPRTWLKKLKARQKLVIRAMPDAMDLITTCVEAGLGLDAASPASPKDRRSVRRRTPDVMQTLPREARRRHAGARRPHRCRRTDKLHHFDHPGGATWRGRRTGSASPVRSTSHEEAPESGAIRARGADQDALSTGPVHLSIVFDRDPGAGRNPHRRFVLKVGVVSRGAGREDTRTERRISNEPGTARRAGRA